MSSALVPELPERILSRRRSWGSAPKPTLVMPDEPFYSNIDDDDDDTILTTPAASTALDAERIAGTSPRTSRRRRKRYTPVSPVGSAIKSVSRSLRRASLRVVNFSNAALENQVRLPDDDEDGEASGREDDTPEHPQEDRWSNTPLRGRTLAFFGSESNVRLTLHHLLLHPWTEPFILALVITNAVVLTIQSARLLTLPSDGSTITSHGYFHTWEDFVLFVIFIIYTLEAFARMCLSGFLFDPEVSLSSIFKPAFYQSLDNFPVASTSSSPSLTRQTSLSRGASISSTLYKIQRVLLRPFTLAPAAKRHYTHPSVSHRANNGRVSVAAEKVVQGINPTYFPNVTDSDSDKLSLPFKLNVHQIHDQSRRNIPYLRNSWNRIDFVAIVSFWITFALAAAGLERGAHHIGVFRAMSVIRCARLLAITKGTTTIMHSFKMAAPLLGSTAYFVIFAMMLFSIIGVQSFRGSLRRSCTLQPTLGENQTQLPQFCGGHIDPNTLRVSPYMKMDGSLAETAKGFICPLDQLCIEGENPKSNVESFDTIYNAALQVIVIASANTWAGLMYGMLDAEYFVSCIFFIICIIVLNFWLLNLFVAVITNTFHSIRAVTKTSAFGATPLVPGVGDDEEDGHIEMGRTIRRKNWAYTIVSHTEWCWILLALASVVLQATRTVETSGWQEALLYFGELGITLAFDVEIVLRIIASLPNWRSFFIHGKNMLDLVLAIGSSAIQLPVIHSSPVYPWLTVFQLARSYRVILVVPNMKPMILAVFGNLYGLLNMTLFLLLVNYIAALVAVQFLRGDVPSAQLMNFGNVYYSFLGVYQLCSSENWTTVLYGVASSEVPFGQTVVTLVYLAFWLLFSYFILLQMFIAVINENFQVAEELKKSKQALDYWAAQAIEEARPSWTRKLNPYRWLKANPVTVKVDNLPPNLVLPMQKSLVQEYNRVPLPEQSKSRSRKSSKPGHYVSRSISTLHRLFVGEPNSNEIPLRNLGRARSGTLVEEEDESDRHLALLAAINTAETSSEGLDDALYERRAQKAEFIRNHPSYDKTFWIFSQKNPLRKWCQRLVQPANGERLFGTPCSPVAHTIFQLVLLLVVLGSIAVESVATPYYRRQYYAIHGSNRSAWFDIANEAFGLILFVEFLIKIIADGFLFTPNAYMKSIWNVLDFFIMASFLVNVATSLAFVGGLSRLTRALKALPALRLITLVDKMRYTFQSLLIDGAPGIIDAAMLCILYMIPYAVWGLNIFAGQLNECNDTSVTGITDCIYEYNNNIYGSAFGYMAPRSWDNPAPSTVFSFDSFRASLLILFEIVSLEGWIDVLGIATSVTGPNLQPKLGSSPVNAVFFLIYNLLGGVVLLTIFVSIIIGNFSAQTGLAYLTEPQREWIDLQKLIKRQRPSKRPKVKPTNPLRSWCFDRAVQKHGWWSRGITIMIILHIIVLMSQTYSTSVEGDRIRNYFFLVFTAIYIVDVAVRLFGLGWSSFRANGWNIFDLFVSIGSFITTAIVQPGNYGYAIEQLQKLFLVSIAFKLVQRTDSLNMLFKTSIASLPAILNLLGLWVVIFIFFAILHMEIFGMTRWGSAETRYQNYSTLARAIVMLTFMSTGEGWNQYMHDYALEYPRCTVGGESDCGSPAWAFSLFIAWNLLSMYIFANLFTGVVVQNFSYVFQTSSSSTKTITREGMRAFKKVWAEFADPKTGYLLPNQFGRFFSRLTGIFEVRIYPAENSIGNIVASCRADARSKLVNIVADLDTRRLAKKLSKIDYSAIRKRRMIYARLFHEARVSHEGQGISFTDMLVLLAHHKIIVDTDALVLKDLMIRTETNKLVTDLVNLDRVRSLLTMRVARRRYLAEREKIMLADVPSIIVDVMPSTPPSSSRDISSALYDFSSSPSSLSGSPSVSGGRYSPSDVSFALEDVTRLRRDTRRASDISRLSADLGSRSPRSSFQDDDPQAILSSIKNSMWGELMQEATEEEENRL